MRLFKNKDTLDYFRDSSTKILVDYQKSVFKSRRAQLKQLKQNLVSEAEKKKLEEDLQKQWKNEDLAISQQRTAIIEATSQEMIVNALQRLEQDLANQTKSNNTALLDQFKTTTKRGEPMIEMGPTGTHEVLGAVVNIPRICVPEGPLPAALGKHARTLTQISDKYKKTEKTIKDTTIALLKKYVEKSVAGDDVGSDRRNAAQRCLDKLNPPDEKNKLNPPVEKSIEDFIEALTALKEANEGITKRGRRMPSIVTDRHGYGTYLSATPGHRVKVSSGSLARTVEAQLKQLKKLSDQKHEKEHHHELHGKKTWGM